MPLYLASGSTSQFLLLPFYFLLASRVFCAFLQLLFLRFEFCTMVFSFSF